MAQTLCIKCGSELKVSSYCQLCREPLIFACTSCDYITEEKVHTDCRNAEVLAKTEAKEEPAAITTTQEGAAAAAATTIASTHTTGNKEETIVDKPKEEETVKAEPSSAPSYLTREQDKENFDNSNPFVAGTAVWQSFVTYWFNTYGEFLKNAPKMTEYWYNTYWKPWLNWMPQRQQQDKDRVKIE
jgi:hypothetical protein